MDRKFIRLAACLALSSLLLRADEHGEHAAPAEAAKPDSHAPPARSAAEVKTARLLRETALSLLKEGNSRFAAGRAQHPNLEEIRRHDLAKNGQTPLATILTCSDSRVPTELIFDRGIGDLFVVRVAGNVASDCEMASIEYGVEHLNTPLLIVLGHSQCGAVTAVANSNPLHGHLPTLARQIEPAVAAARLNPMPNLLAAAVRANVALTASRIIQGCPDVREAAASGMLTVLGAIYDIDTGVVEWINPLAESQPAPVSSVHPAPAVSPAPAPVSHANPTPRPAAHDEEASAAFPAHKEAAHAPEPAHEPAKTAKPAAHGPAPAAEADPDADLELARTPKPKPAPPAVVPRGESAKKAIKAPAKPNKESLLLNPPVSSSTPIGGVARHQSGTTKDNH